MGNSGFKKYSGGAIKPGGRDMNVTAENPREAIVIGQPVVSIKVDEGCNSQVCLGIIAPDVKRIERDRDDLCDPFDSNAADESSHRTGT